MGRMVANPSYRAIHNWVEVRLGKPMECENCGDTSRSRYHWANISGKYLRDITDWVRLCVTCHWLFDGKANMVATHCQRGHERTPENTYRHPTGGNMCRPCKQLTRKRYYARKAIKPGLGR